MSNNKKKKDAGSENKIEVKFSLFLLIPNEILSYIFTMMSLSSLSTSSQVCKKWNNEASKKELWQKFGFQSREDWRDIGIYTSSCQKLNANAALNALDKKQITVYFIANDLAWKLPAQHPTTLLLLPEDQHGEKYQLIKANKKSILAVRENKEFNQQYLSGVEIVLSSITTPSEMAEWRKTLPALKLKGVLLFVIPEEDCKKFEKIPNNAIVLKPNETKESLFAKVVNCLQKVATPEAKKRSWRPW